jgi:lipopolysaccharide transport system permease protein
MAKDANFGAGDTIGTLTGALPASDPGAPGPLPTTVIEPSYGWAALKLGELWQFRELFYFLVWKDIKVRYRQTLLGAAWAIVQPLFTMIVFAVFLGRLAKVPSDGLPYPLFSFTALVPWTFFARGLTLSSDSLVASSHLITKIYFPRLLLPIARIISGLPDLLLTLLTLWGLLWWYEQPFRPISLLWLPPLVLLALLTALGVGLWLSALNVKYRDVQHVVPFMTQLWLFATPIAYPSSLLSEPWRTLYALNPMVGVVEGFRWAVLKSGAAPGPMLLVSALASLTILGSGAFFFRRVERTFADNV